jgi:DNA polymerase I-like protein with 3'-5' exonuclease and polymerase domains
MRCDDEKRLALRVVAKEELDAHNTAVTLLAGQHVGGAFPDPPEFARCGLHPDYSGLVHAIPKVVTRVTRKGVEVTRGCPTCAERWGSFREYRASKAYKLWVRLQTFNPGSDDHVRWLLFDALRLKPIEFTEITKVPKVNLINLQEIAEATTTPEEHVGIVESLIARAHVETRLNVFLDPPLDNEGVMHPNYTLCGTSTLRLRSGRVTSDPDKMSNEGDFNAQNIPKDVRSIWIADPGHVFVSYDAAQIEWIATMIAARCQRAVEMYEREENVHIGNMRLLAPVMGWTVGAMPKKQIEYGYSKSFTHATDYGEGWFNLKRRFKVEAKVAKAGQRVYLDAWPEVEAWQKEVEVQVVATRELRTCFGFRRRFFDVTQKMFKGKKKLGLDRKQFKEALATGPQSMNACLNLIGMNLLADAGFDLVTTVHDELVVQIKEGDLDSVRRGMDILRFEVPEFEPLIGKATFRPRWEAKLGRNLGPFDESNPEGLKEVTL